MIDRRSLLSSAWALSLAGFDPSALLQDGASGHQAHDAEPILDQATFDFWTRQVSAPSQFFVKTNRLPPLHEGVGVAPPEEITFLYYSEADGFQSATDPRFGNTGLASKGDVTVSLSVDTLRPSEDHRQIIEKNGTGSFRVDLKQGKPLPLLSETLNWSAIGSFEGKQESFHTIAFDPKSTWGASKRVPLASGVGFWAWNLSVQSGPTKWSQMLQGLTGRLQASSPSGQKTQTAAPSGTAGGASSAAGAAGAAQANAVFGAGLQVFTQAALSVVGMGLPAMATTGVNAFDKLYAFLHSQSAAKPIPVFQVADTALLATTEARQTYNGRAVSLRPGTYVIVPTQSVSEVASGKYILQDYGLVPSGTKLKEMAEAMKDTLRQYTYCVVSVDIDTHA